MRAGGHDIAVVECHVRYRASAVFEDELAVHCLVAPPTRATFEIALPGAPRRRDVATAVTVHAFLESATGRPLRPPDWVRDISTPLALVSGSVRVRMALLLAALTAPSRPSRRPAAPRGSCGSQSSVVRARHDHDPPRRRIRFRWVSGFHNIRRVSGPSFTRIKSRDRGTVRRAFTEVGRYRLVCTIHRDLGMYLTVRVKR